MSEVMGVAIVAARAKLDALMLQNMALLLLFHAQGTLRLQSTDLQPSRNHQFPTNSD